VPILVTGKSEPVQIRAAREPPAAPGRANRLHRLKTPERNCSTLHP
jgi:hypothetical protein